jgi:hypothetical protein
MTPHHQPFLRYGPKCYSRLLGFPINQCNWKFVATRSFFGRTWVYVVHWYVYAKLEFSSWLDNENLKVNFDSMYSNKSRSFDLLVGIKLDIFIFTILTQSGYQSLVIDLDALVDKTKRFTFLFLYYILKFYLLKSKCRIILELWIFR